MTASTSAETSDDAARPLTDEELGAAMRALHAERMALQTEAFELAEQSGAIRFRQDVIDARLFQLKREILELQ